MQQRSLLLSLAFASLLGTAAPAAMAGDDKHRGHDKHRHEHRHHDDRRGPHGHGHYDQHWRGHYGAYYGGHYGRPATTARPAYWDRDGDGVPNRYDRRPNNPNRY